ncbi:heavy metal-associated isoprenylated plant protein 2-like [Argentina anserina]|uniref:heavy metal-associated isoprenylated plant protein 2-like n=1 Tax=Argentina anserina TaxID=57926 RepID=UPI00217684AB|nr:heavy metal-associated isoprenylated plant protein 2-like [Potentilla anserina]
MKDIVIKVDINCQICKTDVLKAVSKLTGITMVLVDGEKGTLRVWGDVDPVLVVKLLRKARKVAKIISVGPLKPWQPKVTETVFILPPCCNLCELVGLVSYAPYFDGGACNIL